MEAIFWISLLGALYSYLVYPVALLAMPARRVRPIAQAGSPSITVIIAAHYEASRLTAKLENLLACDYARERLEVIVASDGSEDGTDAVAARFADQGVRVVRAEMRGGKEHVQHLAVAAARHDILVFTDVATRMDPGGLRAIVRPFADPRVGAVSSEDRFLDRDGRPMGEGAYVRYEMMLRRLEGRRAGLVGLSGSFFAARRELCHDIAPGVPSDFTVALNGARRGMRAVVAAQAFGYYTDLADDTHEYQRKYRTALRGMAALWRHRDMLNPLRHGLFAWQLWSHKPLRWLVPWCLPACLVSSALAGGSFYVAMFIAQLGLYALVLLGFMSRSLRQRTLVRVPFFFVQANAALAHAFIAFLLGIRIQAWEPSRR
ncbi:MAG: glycosyltransferase family 2 protein [Thiohalomonadaceae bacterium]